MNWFKPKYSVCAVCGVLFDPAIDFDERWSRLCAIHRKPVMERAMRNDAILLWAGKNLERLGKMMDDERAEEAEYKRQRAAMFNVSMSAEHQAQSGSLLGGQYVKFIGKNPYDNSPFK